MGDDLSLDVGLNPHEDPRVLRGEIALEDLDLVAEEMLNLGPKPDQISEEAYLKARRQYVAAKLTSLTQSIKRARAYQAELDGRGEIIGEIAASGGSSL